MPVEILMPSVGPSATEGSIVRWLKQEGVPVKRGEPLVEIESEKALVEVEAQADGVLGKILVGDGTVGIKVHSVVGLIAVNGEDPAALVAIAPQPQPALGRDTSVASLSQAAPPVAASAAAASVTQRGGRVFASPSARRVAAELGIEVALVGGSGPKGRVLRADVEAAARAAVEMSIAAPNAATARNPAPTAAEIDFEDIPHSSMRRAIAQRLSEAKRTVPHFYLSVDCGVDVLLTIRQQINQQIEGVKLSVNDFIVKAAALALRRVPGCNASWTEDAIRRYRNVDIAVAVATPGGLITPIVRNADRKSLASISTEIKALVSRANDGKLRPEEFQGGSFTVSNLGMFGVRDFSAIVNPPQACILAIGASEPRAVVRDGALAVATQMTCTLSADHRIVDGALGAEFLAEFRRLIENPLAML